MKIIFAGFQAAWMMVSWAVSTLWREYMVDLHIDKWPWHPNDYIWFAERWNGRFAMFGVIAVLQLELIYKESFWKLIGVL